MELYLLRHGDAVDRFTGGYARDEERPLTERGREEARAAALALRELRARPDQVVTSPLVRAQQTAQIVAEVTDPVHGLRTVETLAPGGGLEAIAALLAETPTDSALVLVGHMPDLGEIAGWLLWNDPLATLPFRTGGLCRITVPTPPGPGGDLRWFLPPKLLRKLG
jgi:phosphohistidine phosphatase